MGIKLFAKQNKGAFMENKKEELKKKLLAICRFFENGNKITEDEKYIYDEFSSMNYHKTIEENINCFFDMADLLELFDYTEYIVEIERLKARLEVKENQLNMYKELLHIK